MKKPRILVVEDESIIALDIMTNLVNLGFEVTDSAMTAAEAVKKTDELLPDLVLMDIHLKGNSDGIEAAGIIRKNHNIPIVYMTGNADLATVNRARATEPYGYIIKPVNLQDLFSTIDTALHRSLYDQEINQINIQFESVIREYRQNLEELEATNEELAATMEEQQATNEQLIIANEELLVAQKDILESNRLIAKGEQRFRGLFESMTEGVAFYSLIFDNGVPVDYCILDVNPAFETHTGLSCEKVKGSVGSEFYGITPPPYLALYSRVAMTGKPEYTEIFFPPINRYFKTRIFSPGKNLFVTVFEDTTNRNQTEVILKADNSADTIWHTDENFVFTYISPAGEKILDLSPGEMIGRSILDMVEPEEREYLIQSSNKRVQQEQKGEMTSEIRYEVRMRKKDGTPVWFEVNVNPFRNNTGAITGYHGISRDISERKKADQVLKSSLSEKEILIKEIHHRVKNNLQMINSLLNLQSTGVSDPVVKEKFLTLQNRIRSMAIVHERLYKSEDLGRIDFEDYINIIVYELSGNYSMTKETGELKINTQKIYLDIDKAIPCGLILNELMTNIYKYAFPDDWAGDPEVSVDLSLDKNSMVTLIVSDNGVGIPFDGKMSNASTLGLTLVKMLTAQLQGTVQIDTKKGTRIQITFPTRQDNVMLSS